MKDSYEDEEEEIEGPKSSFSTYLAEGDALYKQGEHKKALDSYTLVGLNLNLFAGFVCGCECFIEAVTCLSSCFNRHRHFDE